MGPKKGRGRVCNGSDEYEDGEKDAIGDVGSNGNTELAKGCMRSGTAP
jgi:hypothetical protein